MSFAEAIFIMSRAVLFPLGCSSACCPSLGGFASCCSALRSFSLCAATNHPRTGDISSLVYEIEETGFFLYADLGNFFGHAAFFVAAGHLRARNVPSLIDKIEVSLLLFDSYFCNFLYRHVFTSFRFDLSSYSNAAAVLFQCLKP